MLCLSSGVGMSALCRRDLNLIWSKTNPLNSVVMSDELEHDLEVGCTGRKDPDIVVWMLSVRCFESCEEQKPRSLEVGALAVNGSLEEGSYGSLRCALKSRRWWKDLK